MSVENHAQRTTMLVVLAALYAWFATGVAPFTVSAYVLVAVPSLAVLTLYARDGAFTSKGSHELRRDPALVATLRTNVVPWLVVLALALGLEVFALALGGRSKPVPTLSTTLDHLLVTHWLRGVLFWLWLSVGVAPLRHRARHGAPY